MKPANQSGLGRILLIASILGVFLSGCTVVGPSAVRHGRLAYSAAINETNSQQMLMFVVQNRYEEMGSLLAVTNVTANVSITASTGVQLGFGDQGDYAGSLVPFSAGVLYEENPTISYVPAVGAEYARRVFSPVPLAVLAQMTGTLVDPAFVYQALVASVNGIQNPDFHFPAAAPDPRFSRLVTLMRILHQANHLHWIENPRSPATSPSSSTGMSLPIQPRLRNCSDCWGLKLRRPVTDTWCCRCSCRLMPPIRTGLPSSPVRLAI